MQLKIDSTLQGGKYKIEKILGQGGFGITYLAEQSVVIKGDIGAIKTKIKVTIKEFFMKDLCNRDTDNSHISVGSVGSQELVTKFQAKFIKEAQNIAKLNHDNIIKVLDIFEENGSAYYVMEYIDGGSLSDKIAAQGSLSETEALHYTHQIANALQYIHSQSINHLDVKPANILIKEGAVAVLIDFGLAKQYDQSGSQTSSTPVGISKGYAPMEQYNQGGVSTFSPATDIYALGATLYKMVTGTTPPHANEIYEDGLPELPATLSSGIKAAITAAMQPRRKDRPQSANAFLALLGDTDATIAATQDSEATAFIDTAAEATVITPAPTPTPTPAPAPAPTPAPAPKPAKAFVTTPTTPKKKRNFSKIIIAAIVAMIVLGGGMIFLSNDNNEIKEPQQLPEKIFTKEDYENMGSPADCVIPYGYTAIGEDAFFGSYLTSISIPNSVTSIGEWAFGNCLALTSISIPNSVTSIGERAFEKCHALTSISIPNSVTSIGKWAFCDCYDLTSISIPNSVTSIGGGAFKSCHALTSISIPNSVTSIRESTFESCAALTSISIPNSVTSIGESAFGSCYALTSISIPSSVTVIGAAAFLRCSALTSISIPNSVTSIGEAVFNGCNKLTSDGVHIDNNNFILDNGMLFNSNKTHIIATLYTSINYHVDIPNSVTSIRMGAFSFSTNLYSIYIPNSVTKIGDYVFKDCNALTSICIPNSVTEIGYNAFDDCDSLTSIYVSSSSPVYNQLRERYGDIVIAN